MQRDRKAIVDGKDRWTYRKRSDEEKTDEKKTAHREKGPRDIAAAHGGNWHMSDAGRLRLVPLLSAPAESSLLVTEHGDAILFGGVRILV